MRNPQKMFLGFTWVGWLNIFFLQWFFVRLAYSDRNTWKLLKGIVPMTGWWSEYIYIRTHRMMRTRPTKKERAKHYFAEAEKKIMKEKP